MITSFIITFRETLEVALIVGIILGYLFRTKQTRYNNIVYIGIVSGIMASILIALGFLFVSGGFEGRAEAIFEGATMLIGALLLTTMILWMMGRKNIALELKGKVARNLNQSSKTGLFLLVFVSVIREGAETVIFLGANSFVTASNGFLGAILGIVAAIFLGYLIFISSLNINIKLFFNITSILLILFAAGLVAHGIHEFQEAGVIPIVVEHVWDINPELNPDGSYPLLHEKGNLGSIFKGLFGYNGNPSLIEVLSYIAYLILISILWTNFKPKKRS